MDNSQNSSRAMKWIPIAAVIGMAAGATIGLLYAPKGGKDTRQYLRDRMIQMREQAKDAIKRARSCMPSKGRVEEEVTQVPTSG